MGELRDLYDKNSNLTGLTYHKGENIPEGYYSMVVMAVIRNSNGEFLMQKRAINKGGDWGVTGGHPKSGETPLEGIITEIKEELSVVKWFKLEELENMVLTKELNDNQISCFIKCTNFIKKIVNN